MDFVKEALRQTAIVAVSTVMTLAVWLPLRLLLSQANVQIPKIGEYLLVILVYTAIRLGIKSRVRTKHQ